ncbi:hypothetical protein JZ751_002581 [Albula glossodonta]|uniref:Probable proton-coupled zinc antiporter SLC30A3 n=1 Tax=Albula glossodonta TaxID=121402 RepID=A0A8T2N8G4_9TELE|nr:hypothetical protein JZ751_002581 [Albula glossodonta]
MAEILGAFVSVTSIWIVTGVLLFLAVQRVIHSDYEIDGNVMLITSGCAVGINFIHTHSSGYHRLTEDVEYHPIVHGHSHGLLRDHGNTSVRAAFVHVVGDLLQSTGVLVAATVIYFQPEYKIADPLCTFLFSVFVLGTTISVLKDVIRILMEVKGVHSLHLWALTQGHTLISTHLAIGETPPLSSNPQDILQEATELLQASFGFSSTTIQVELYSQDMAHCGLCQDPAD